MGEGGFVKILITGGGTGGHVFPAIAVADAVRRAAPDAELLYVGGQRGLEAEAVPAARISFAAVPARGLLGSRWYRWPAILWTTVRGLIAAGRIMRRFQPDVVFATGGYVSGSVALAAWIARRPIVLHEQNSVPGMTNRMLSRLAVEVHLNTPAARRHFPKRRHLKLSGNPIRESVRRGDAYRAQQAFDLDRDRRTIFVFGGSQGARSLNRAVVGAAGRLGGREDVQLLVQTGRRDLRWVTRRLRAAKVPAVVRPFIDAMGDAYAASDLVVARAGAMTLSEITACGKASILVPFPYATHNHQESNARWLVEAGAAVMIEDRALNGRRLAAQVLKLIDTPRKLREMSNNALRMARPHAAEKIAAALLRYAAGDGNGNGEEAPGAERPAQRHAATPRTPGGRRTETAGTPRRGPRTRSHREGARGARGAGRAGSRDERRQSAAGAPARPSEGSATPEEDTRRRSSRRGRRGGRRRSRRRRTN